MPISLSSLRSAAGSLAGRGGTSSGSRLVVRNGRAYKLVPAGAKMQRRHRRTSSRPDRMGKILELAVIASILKGSSH